MNAEEPVRFEGGPLDRHVIDVELTDAGTLPPVWETVAGRRDEPEIADIITNPVAARLAAPTYEKHTYHLCYRYNEAPVYVHEREEPW